VTATLPRSIGTPLSERRRVRLLARRTFARGARRPVDQACAGSQRRAAEYLLSRGADLSWQPDYAWGTPLDAAAGPSTRQENVLTWLRWLGAPSARKETP
jgi:hypothetical protein